MTRVAIIGAGAWGTALALQAVRAGSGVTLWARAPGLVAGGENPRLPGHRLPAGITVVTELPSADLLLLAVPMQHLRGVAARCRRGARCWPAARGWRPAVLPCRWRCWPRRALAARPAC